MPIQLLPEHIATQIAAGEVIERPASVVKELIENALDSGATRVEIEVTGSGVEMIRCSDNGVGIPSDELTLALTRHATSKISKVDDLFSIRTLGFRGEALASIASVAFLTLTSRHEDAEIGARATAEGGTNIEIDPVGAPVGTVVEVGNLFFNVPARRKFLKSETTERRHISNMLSSYAMAYSDVYFSLRVNGRESFRTSGNGRLGDVVVDIMGVEVFRDMIEVKPVAHDSHRSDLPTVEVSGFTTMPSRTRSNRSEIILFVNGRNIQDQRLTYAVVQAYHTLIPQGRYPIAVLMIEVDPSEVDVNVHPTKAEVRFRAPEAVFSAVQRSVRQAVLEFSEEPSISQARFGARPDDAPHEPFSHYEANTRNPRVVDHIQLGIDLDTPDTGRRTHQLAPDEESEDDFIREIPSTGEKPQRPRNLPPLRIVGQIGATYIVAEGPVGMYLIDQHAAHERILYEEFMAAFDRRETYAQLTLDSTVVELPAREARVVEEYASVLKGVGFEFEPFGNNAFKVRAVPAVFADADPDDVLRRVVQDVEVGDKPGGRDIEEKIVRRVCKTAAVKAGQVLSYEEMQGLVRQLERCENPLTCPHGRPTMIHMSSSDLEREFGRT